MGEDETEKLEKAIVEALIGTQVSVVAGPIFGDLSIKPLSKEGAQSVLDRLRGRGFKVTRI